MKNARCVLLAVLLVASCSGKRQPSQQRVVLVPIGSVPADVLEHLRRDLPVIVKRDVTIGAPIPRPVAAFDPTRKQYRGSVLLQELEGQGLADADRIVGIIDGDAYAPGLNFIFGQAKRPGRVAVVALPRLRESFRGREEDVNRFHERVLKVTSHELGHAFGFKHCLDRKCVMHFANSVGEVDQSGVQYCSRERVPD